MDGGQEAMRAGCLLDWGDRGCPEIPASLIGRSPESKYRPDRARHRARGACDRRLHLYAPAATLAGTRYHHRKGRTQAVYVPATPAAKVNRVRINTLALAAHVPTMLGVREYVEAGGLMSYGPNWPHMWARAADFVDKILRGAKPGDIPVEQPTKFDFVINLTTAKALGLTVPDKAARTCRRGDRIAMLLLHRVTPLMAQSGHTETDSVCPLSGVKRT